MSLRSQSPQPSCNFAAAQFGSPSQWRDHVLEHPRLGRMPGKAFLGEALELTAMEVSLGSMLPGESMPFLHAHQQNEELYLILAGEGEMLVDGDLIPLRAGTAIRIAQAGLRAWRCTGHAPLVYGVIQARAGSLEQAASRDGLLPEVELAWPEASGPVDRADDQGLAWPLGKVFL